MDSGAYTVNNYKKTVKQIERSLKMIIQKAVKLAMEVFEQKMEDFAGNADAMELTADLALDFSAAFEECFLRGRPFRTCSGFRKRPIFLWPAWTGLTFFCGNRVSSRSDRPNVPATKTIQVKIQLIKMPWQERYPVTRCRLNPKKGLKDCYRVMLPECLSRERPRWGQLAKAL